jgi:uncharacterized protein YukE
MTDILIRPPELRNVSEQLKTSATKIGVALQTIDNDILSLKGDRFIGNRANSVQSNYAPKREALIKANGIVFDFASDLITAAEVFEHADKVASLGNGDPSGIDWIEFGRDEFKNGAAVLIHYLKELEKLDKNGALVIGGIINLIDGYFFNNEDPTHALISTGINVGIKYGLETGLETLFGTVMLWSGGIQIVGNIGAAMLEASGQYQAASILQNSLDVIDVGGYINDLAEGITDWIINPSHPNPFEGVMDRISPVFEVSNMIINGSGSGAG